MLGCIFIDYLVMVNCMARTNAFINAKDVIWTATISFTWCETSVNLY